MHTIQRVNNLNRENLTKNNLTSKTTQQNEGQYLKLTPSEISSKYSGGTSHLLPNERKNATFKTEDMIHLLNGGPEKTKRRKFFESMISKDTEDAHQIYNHDRAESVKHALKEFIRIHKPYKNFKVTREDILYMSQVAIATGALNNSHSIFIGTVIGQGNDEQVQYWVPKILSFEITGSYAQTELGHGSNVRGLQTTAEYDSKTEEFVLNTPTLQSIKWWPGCLGKVATHCVLYAQLIVDGVEKGLNVFMIQIRDENHLPLAGIRLGDLGSKLGDAANDTGFMILDNIRVPRDAMLMKYKYITKEGKYVELVKADSKVNYTTMMTTRATMVHTAGARLAYAATIAIRYSCVRSQGFAEMNNKSFKDREFVIMDYKIQQYRLFKQLAIAYATKFTGRWMMEQLELMEGGTLGVIKDVNILKELASTSAGLKSLCTLLAAAGLEECRKCCGGNGYLLSSGIAAVSVDYLWQVTAEGDASILALLTGKHLLKSLGKLMTGRKLTGIMDYFNVLVDCELDLSKVKPPIAKGAEDYFNLDYLFDLFKYKSLYRNFEAAKDFNETITEKGISFLEAFNHCGMDILIATQSHCFYIIMLNFVTKIKGITDLSLRNVLTKLCIVFACCNFLDENWGDIIDDSQFKVIRQVAYSTMGDLRKDAVALVDSFDFTDNTLKSTIGRYDGNVYEALFDAAQKSILNRKDPFDGYEELLKPHTNKELLKKGNKPYLKTKF